MRTTFDFDGVIAKDFRLSQSPLIERLVNRYLLATSVGKILYLCRPANQKTLQWIKKRKERGEKIVVVSATRENHRPLVEKLLARYNLHIDQLLLRNEEAVVDFKIKVLMEYGCRFYVEDNPKIVEDLVTRFGVKVRKLNGLFVIMIR